jgi:ABC-type xylose transport system permease subunit
MYMMLRLVILLSSGTLLATAHALAITFYIYWHYAWFDVPMHILGGATVAFAMGTLCVAYVRMPSLCRTRAGILTTVLIVGLCWEVFEYAAGISIATDDSFILDTGIDFIMDLLGGLIGYTMHTQISKLETWHS